MADEFKVGDEIVELGYPHRFRVVAVGGNWYHCRRIRRKDGESKYYDCQKDFAHKNWVKVGWRKVKVDVFVSWGEEKVES